MKNVLILHGTGATSKDNWFPWLKERLEGKGCKVWVPDLPDAEKPDIKKYKRYIYSNWAFNSDSVVVGHSSGAAAILGLLQNLPAGVVIDKAILVGGFVGDLGRKDLTRIAEKRVDWDKIREHCKKFILIHSDNDPHVPLENGEVLKEKLGGELIIIKGQKHFNISDAGRKYLKFPKLLEYI